MLGESWRWIRKRMVAIAAFIAAAAVVADNLKDIKDAYDKFFTGPTSTLAIVDVRINRASLAGDILSSDAAQPYHADLRFVVQKTKGDELRNCTINSDDENDYLLAFETKEIALERDAASVDLSIYVKLWKVNIIKSTSFNIRCDGIVSNLVQIDLPPP